MESKTIRPEIGSDGQGERHETCIGVVWIKDRLVNRDEMTIIVKCEVEIVKGTRWNGYQGRRWVGGSGGRERRRCISRC